MCDGRVGAKERNGREGARGDEDGEASGGVCGMRRVGSQRARQQLVLAWVERVERRERSRCEDGS